VRAFFVIATYFLFCLKRKKKTKLLKIKVVNGNHRKQIEPMQLFHPSGVLFVGGLFFGYNPFTTLWF